MALRSIIVDDEHGCREAMSALIARYCPSVEVVGMADSAADGASLIREARPDLVLLDIEMPYGDGFQLLEMVRGVECGVIFTTAFDHYAIRAIRTCALDYLLKPIVADELVAAVERAERELAVKRSRRLEALIENISAREIAATRIALPTADDVLFVQIRDIIRCEAAGNYTVIHLRGGESPMVSRTLKEYETLLADAGFFRAHNSHLINLAEVKRYLKGDGVVVMQDGSEITVSRRKKEELLARLEGR